MVVMSSSCFNYMYVNRSQGNFLMDEPTYQRLRPSSKMLMAKKKVFLFLVSPIAKIGAIRDTALPAFAKLFYFCNNFIFKFIFLFKISNLLAGDHEVTCSSMRKP